MVDADFSVAHLHVTSKHSALRESRQCFSTLLLLINKLPSGKVIADLEIWTSRSHQRQLNYFQYFIKFLGSCTFTQIIMLVLTKMFSSFAFGLVVQSLSHVQLFATPWTAACQASLSFTISLSLLKLMSIESLMPSNHLVLCCLLLMPSIFPSIRVFSNELALHIR